MEPWEKAELDRMQEMIRRQEDMMRKNMESIMVQPSTIGLDKLYGGDLGIGGYIPGDLGAFPPGFYQTVDVSALQAEISSLKAELDKANKALKEKDELIEAIIAEMDDIEVLRAENERLKNPAPPVQGDGWIKWEAKEDSVCPLPNGTEFLAMFKSGSDYGRSRPWVAPMLSWGSGKGVDQVIAYKIIPQEGEWIEWHGGENPCPGRNVEVKLRTASELTNSAPSECYTWKHAASCFYDGSDITWYRIVND